MLVNRITLAFLLMFFSLQSYSEVELKGQDINSLFPKIEESIYSFEDGALVWGVKLLSSPEALKGMEFVSNDSYRVIQENGLPIGIFLYKAETQIDFTKDGQSKNLNFVWKPVAWQGIRYHKCGQGAPRLVPPKNAPPLKFYVMMACSLVNNKYFMTLTYDPKAEIEASSIFELSGKGESFKHYEVPAAKPGSIFGQLKFNYENTVYEVSLYLTKEASSKVKNTAAVERNTIMFGTSSLNIASSDFSAQDSKYTFGYEFLSAPVFDKLQLGGQAHQSFALSSGSGASDISRTWVTGYLHYGVLNRSQWSLAARLIGGLLSFQDSVSNLELTSFQAGYGLNFQYDFLPKQRIIFGFEKVGMMSESVKDHMAISLQYQYQMSNGRYIGLGYLSNSFQAANSTSGISRTLSSNDILLTYGF